MTSKKFIVSSLTGIGVAAAAGSVACDGLNLGGGGNGVASGATGTGFYCGRRYDRSEFGPGESRALLLTCARRALLGWV